MRGEGVRAMPRKRFETHRSKRASRVLAAQSEQIARIDARRAALFAEEQARLAAIAKWNGGGSAFSVK